MSRNEANAAIAAPFNKNQTISAIPVTASKRTSIWNSFTDFWMLGGLSILLWIVLHIANVFREDLPVFQMRFQQIVAVFSMLSIVCNHPHFMISYRFGYGRGSGFVLKNWFPLILVPVALVGVYVVAFCYFNTDISQSPFVTQANSILSWMGLRFRIGGSTQLGSEVVGLSIWLMYITVGWHYCKQVYGCMMVYAFYDGYRLESWQKHILKWSVISVAWFQFFSMIQMMEKYSSSGNYQDPRFQGFYLAPLGLPEWLLTFSTLAMIIFALSFLTMMVSKFYKQGQLPSVNFLIPWVAFFIWWVPTKELPEYYVMMVPFFHSLQYLPFALRLEDKKIQRGQNFNLRLSVRIFVLLLVGVLSFELIPSILDKYLETEIHQSAWFFTTAIAVFINVHHFFIDSAVWKFKDSHVKDVLLYEKN